MPTEWALAKAREWMEEAESEGFYSPKILDSLAALLDSVREEQVCQICGRPGCEGTHERSRVEAVEKARADTLAEVRRIVEEARNKEHRPLADNWATGWQCCGDEILKRLEGLK